MKGIDELEFYTEATKGGRFVGRVREFPKLRSRAMVRRLDAVDEIVTLTAERIAEIESARWDGARRASA